MFLPTDAITDQWLQLGSSDDPERTLEPPIDDKAENLWVFTHPKQ